jgi:hypothetical protein
MERYFAQRIIDESSLVKFFESQDSKDLDELQIISLSLNDKQSGFCSINATVVDTDRFGRCFVGGTGTGDFIDMLYGMGQFVVADGELQNSLTEAIFIAVGLASQIVANELATGSTLSSYYGGGVEIATNIDGKLQKIGDVLHLF